MKKFNFFESTGKDFVALVEGATLETVDFFDERDQLVKVTMSEAEEVITKLVLKQVRKAYAPAWSEKYAFGTADHKAVVNYALSEVYYDCLARPDATFSDIIVIPYVDRHGRQKHYSRIFKLMEEYEKVNFPRHRMTIDGKVVDSYTCELTEDMEQVIPSSHYPAPEAVTVAKIMKDTLSFYDDRLNTVYEKASPKVCSYMLDYMEGKTLEDIAKSYGVTKGTIKKTLSRAASLA